MKLPKLSKTKLFLILTALVGMFAIFFGVSIFYDKYKVSFQSPIRTPIIITERQSEVIIKYVEKEKQEPEVEKQSLLPEPKPLIKKAEATGKSVQEIVLAYFPSEEWDALTMLLHKESSWNEHAVNPTSGACGLFQALPCEKLGCPDLSDVECQAEWGSKYIKSRYGTADDALAFHKRNGWY